MSTPILPMQLPLFPLPDHVLLPEMPTLYRIFEPRYRALVQDLQAKPQEEQWLAVPRLRTGWQLAYHVSPEFHAIATAARLRRAVALPDGEFHIVVEGVRRCELTELASIKPYRLARPLPCEDLLEPEVDALAALRGLLERISSLGDRVRLAEGLPAEGLDAAEAVRILDRLAGVLLAEADDRQSWLECRQVSRRLHMLEAAIERVRQSQPAPTTRRFRPSQN
jgi:Lon protease-like protein